MSTRVANDLSRLRTICFANYFSFNFAVILTECRRDAIYTVGVLRFSLNFKMSQVRSQFFAKNVKTKGEFKIPQYSDSHSCDQRLTNSQRDLYIIYSPDGGHCIQHRIGIGNLSFKHVLRCLKLNVFLSLLYSNSE
jgi:hypothetical protein